MCVYIYIYIYIFIYLYIYNDICIITGKHFDEFLNCSASLLTSDKIQSYVCILISTLYSLLYE